MIYGTFNDKEGKYCFNGKWYKPRWMANGIRNRNWVDIYNICIQGYDTPVGSSLAHWPKAVLVICNITGLKLWDQLAASYEGIYAQSQLHYYDASIPAGQMPIWANAWKSSGNLLIHEYKAGKVAWLREGDFENDIYIFMEDCDPPSEDTDSSTGSIGGDTSGGTPTSTTSVVSGGLFPPNSKTSIKWELVEGKVVPTEITVKAIESE